MRSPITAIAWDIWCRGRTQIWLAAAATLGSCVLNTVVPDSIREGAGQGPLQMLKFFLAVASLLLVLAAFGYTEFNPQKSSSGFPHRLFVLPVTSFQLVAVPMVLGVAAIEAVTAAWIQFGIPPQDRSWWIALTVGVYMVLYQTMLWTLARLGAMRTLVLGLTGVFFIMLRIFPFVRRLSDSAFAGSLVSVAIAGFCASWIFVVWQRSGGAPVRGHWLPSVEALSKRMPARERIFASPAAAQFWFERRRSGSVLPLLVGALIALVIGPVSWYLRDDGSATLRILAATLAMPMILALAIGKAFSKPDFWSKDLSVPTFLAVRPLTAVDIVATKLKVAALSTLVSWLLVLTFLSLWLPLWASPDSFATIRRVLRSLQGVSAYPAYAIAVLGVVACVLLTWRFLVGGLWLGLSGNSKVFALAAIPYVLVPVFGFPALVVSLRFNESVFDWIRANAGRWFPVFLGMAAAAVIAKFWIAAVSWRRISRERLRQYLPLWVGSTLCIVAFAILLSDAFSVFLRFGAYRLKSLALLTALLGIPLARIGLAPRFLEKNRHRG